MLSSWPEDRILRRTKGKAKLEAPATPPTRPRQQHPSPTTNLDSDEEVAVASETEFPPSTQPCLKRHQRSPSPTESVTEGIPNSANHSNKRVKTANQKQKRQESDDSESEMTKTSKKIRVGVKEGTSHK